MCTKRALSGLCVVTLLLGTSSSAASGEFQRRPALRVWVEKDAAGAIRLQWDPQPKGEQSLLFWYVLSTDPIKPGGKSKGDAYTMIIPAKPPWILKDLKPGYYAGKITGLLREDLESNSVLFEVPGTQSAPAEYQFIPGKHTGKVPPSPLKKVGTDKFEVNYAGIGLGRLASVVRWKEEWIAQGKLPKGVTGLVRPIDKVALRVDEENSASCGHLILEILMSLEDHPVSSRDLARFLNAAKISLRCESTGKVFARTSIPVPEDKINGGLIYYADSKCKKKGTPAIGFRVIADDLFALEDGVNTFTLESGKVASQPLIVRVGSATGSASSSAPAVEPILKAAASGDVSKITELLAKDPKLANAKDPNDDKTPLHYAAAEGQLDAVKLLIEKGADVNAKAKNGFTPLHLASYRVSSLFPYRRIAEVLIAKGAAVNAKDLTGATPLHAASRVNSKDVADLLISKRADVNAKAKGDITPLHLAAEGFNLFANGKWTGDLLIAKKADVNAKGYTQQFTPLHIAAGMGNEKIVAKLLGNGANPNAKSKEGKTPLQIAKKHNRDAVVKMLLKVTVKE